jgi:hypothetical protein
VVFLSFEQQDFDSAVFALSFEQQLWPFAHFFDLFFLPLSAKVTPVTSKAAVASKNNFFIYYWF